jgi:hypothetical protein
LGGERWDGKEEEGETEEESVGRWVHIMVFSDGITDGLLPSVIPSVTTPRHCTAISMLNTLIIGNSDEYFTY